MDKTEKMQKVVIKVLKEGQIQWVHFSTIPRELYRKFLRVTTSEPTDLNKYLSEWCKQDFDTYLRMYKFDDIYHLKKAIVERYETEYSELYTKNSRLFVKGWVRMWFCKHLKEEIALCKEKEKEKSSE